MTTTEPARRQSGRVLLFGVAALVVAALGVLSGRFTNSTMAVIGGWSSAARGGTLLDR